MCIFFFCFFVVGVIVVGVLLIVVFVGCFSSIVVFEDFVVFVVDFELIVFVFVFLQDQDGFVDIVVFFIDYFMEEFGIEVIGVVLKDYQVVVEVMGVGQVQIGFLLLLQLWQVNDMYDVKVVLQIECNGNIIYFVQFMMNNLDKYCDDELVECDGMLFCNGVDVLKGLVGFDSIDKVKGVKVVVFGFGLFVGYIYLILVLQEVGFDIDVDIQQIFVIVNDVFVFVVYNGDVEVGFSFWDVCMIVVKDILDVGQKVVVFVMIEEILNDGVVLFFDLLFELQDWIMKVFEDFLNMLEGFEIFISIYLIIKFVLVDFDLFDVVVCVVQVLGFQ